MKQGGFTIVESLIVLSITAALAVSAFAFVANRQNRTQFQVAANNARQQMEQILNETSSGFFPTSDLHCSVAGGALNFGSGGQQGGNAGCVFLGKTVLFAIPGRSQLDAYTTYPIAGQQFTNATPATSLAAATPTIIPGLQQTTVLQNGLTVYSMYYAVAGDTDVSRPTGAFGYLTNLQDLSTTGGSQQFQLYALDHTTAGLQPPLQPLASPNAAVSAINSAGNYVAASAVKICLSNGVDESVLLQLGDLQFNNSSTVTQHNYASKDCS